MAAMQHRQVEEPLAGCCEAPSVACLPGWCSPV
jgi:hypothetical protein